MKSTRKVHILRHTFCSALASRGAPAAAIQKLAGHTDLATTQRYMHLSPEEAARAIELLEKHPEPATNRARIGFGERNLSKNNKEKASPQRFELWFPP